MIGLITEEKLLEQFKCHKTTLKKYLCRAEFYHIQKVKLAPNKYILKNITEQDVQKLKELTSRKQNKRKSN